MRILCKYIRQVDFFAMFFYNNVDNGKDEGVTDR